MKAFLSLLFVALIESSVAFGQESVAPAIVDKGFDELLKNGSLAAMAVWLAGSSREFDQDQESATGRLNQIQQRRGRTIGHEIVRIVPLSPSTERVYAVVKFEKGIAWMSFDCYRAGKDWIIDRFDFSTSANQILPPNILGGQ
jgi:hypothetical protein